MGSDIDNSDPWDWMVGDTPAFTANDIDVTCGPDGKLHGTSDMTGLDNGWVGGDATGCRRYEADNRLCRDRITR